MHYTKMHNDSIIQQEYLWENTPRTEILLDTMNAWLSQYSVIHIQPKIKTNKFSYNLVIDPTIKLYSILIQNFPYFTVSAFIENCKVCINTETRRLGISITGDNLEIPKLIAPYMMLVESFDSDHELTLTSSMNPAIGIMFKGISNTDNVIMDNIITNITSQIFYKYDLSIYDKRVKNPDFLLNIYKIYEDICKQIETHIINNWEIIKLGDFDIYTFDINILDNILISLNIKSEVVKSISINFSQSMIWATSKDGWLGSDKTSIMNLSEIIFTKYKID